MENDEEYQSAHTDLLGILDVKDGQIVPGVNLPLSCIWALEDDTFVYVYDKENPNAQPRKISIPKGNIFIFAGDVIHGGMESKGHDNLRAHILLKTKEFRSGGDVQGWLKIIKCGSWDRDVWKYKTGSEKSV